MVNFDLTNDHVFQLTSGNMGAGLELAASHCAAEWSYGLSLDSTLHRMNGSLIVVLLAGLVLCHGQDCPNLPCYGCTNPGSNIDIICVAGGLTSFPLLPEDVQPRVEELNLRNNEITEITAYHLVNYTSLETLLVAT